MTPNTFKITKNVVSKTHTLPTVFSVTFTLPSKLATKLNKPVPMAEKTILINKLAILGASLLCLRLTSFGLASFESVFVFTFKILFLYTAISINERTHTYNLVIYILVGRNGNAP